jgi:hypothetical protein
VAQPLHAASVSEVAVVQDRHDVEEGVEQNLLSAQAASAGGLHGRHRRSRTTPESRARPSAEALRRP